MPPSRGRRKSSAAAAKSKSKATEVPQDDDSQTATTWTTNHHLVGTTLVSGRVLQPVAVTATTNPLTTATATTNPIMPTTTTRRIIYSDADMTTAPLAAFLPPQRLDPRQPALWRAVVVPSSSAMERTTPSSLPPVALALDCVAHDLQQQQQQTNGDAAAAAASNTNSSCIPMSLTASLAPIVEARLADIFYQHVVEDWLPTLVLLAAVEEVNLQYLKQRQRESNSAATSTSTTSRHGKNNNKTSSGNSSGSLPEYYRKPPSAYLTPPTPVQSKNTNNEQQLQAMPVTFTPSQLVTRIKQGCRLAFTTLVSSSSSSSDVLDAATSKATKAARADAAAAAISSRRSSTRIAKGMSMDETETVAAAMTNVPASLPQQQQQPNSIVVDPTYTWTVVPGGKIALYLKQHLVDNEDEQPTSNRAANGDEPMVAVIDSTTIATDMDVSPVKEETVESAPSNTQEAAAEEESPPSPPPSPSSSMAEDEEEKPDADDDFEPKDDDGDDEDAPDDDSANDGAAYVKENIKDLELEPEPAVKPLLSDVEPDTGVLNEDDEEESPNPYLPLTNSAVMEWLGRKTAKLLTVSDVQSVFHVLLLRDQAAASAKKKRRVAIRDIGEDATSLLSSVDELIWNRILSSSTGILGSERLGQSSRLVLKLAEQHEDDDVVKWETQYFGKTNFVVGLANDDDPYSSEAGVIPDAAREEEQRYKQQKAHDKWRFKGIHGGYTIWPSWSETVKDLIQQRHGGSTIGRLPIVDSEQASEDAQDTTDSDLALAQALAEQASVQDAASGRRTRRGGESGVFYGSQSNMTPKQLMDTLLRMTSQTDFQTALGLLAAVPDESTDPLRRIRTALGRLVWKRNQLARITIDDDFSNKHIISSLATKPLLKFDENDDRRDVLCRYLQQLHTTELHIRRLVLENLTRVPVAIIATAADERPGSMECMDDADFEDQSTVEWQSSGHELVGQRLFRPLQLHTTDDTSLCRWFRVKDFAPSVALSEDGIESSEQSAIGNAKEPTSVERRLRFRAAPLNGPNEDVSMEGETSGEWLLLTEAQTRAGVLAAEMSRQDTESSRAQATHPFASGLHTKISLVPLDNDSSTTQPRSFTVVGHMSVQSVDKRIMHKILIVEDGSTSNPEASWATLVHNATECRLEQDPMVYSIQYFDYDSSSPAYQECQKIIKFMQRQDKAGLFLFPVDPIALNIPTYRSVVKHPMDVSTLEMKLQDGEYAKMLPGPTSYRTTVGRMLNGPFRADVELIFDNAMLFNPPGDWVHSSASQMKSSVLKKIEQATVAAEGLSSGRGRYSSNSVYVDEDSDVDMYVYESDQDEEYGTSRRHKKRKQPADSIPKEDTSARAMERSYKLQKIIGDVLGGPLAGLPVKTDPSAFAFPEGWSCRLGHEEEQAPEVPSDNQDDELDSLVALQQQVEEHESSGLRRSSRAHIADERPSVASKKTKFMYFQADEAVSSMERLPSSRAEVEFALESLHESFYAEMYREYMSGLVSDAGYGLFADESFPPYMGHVVPVAGNDEVAWEIRSVFMAPAFRWVIRGLIKSGHLGEIEPLSLDSLSSGAIIANHAYYIDDRRPYDVIDVKELQRRKRSGQEADEPEEEVELSEYEKLRAERVARNAERLRSLGLA